MNSLFKSIHSCTKCKLHFNQLPLIDPCECSDVFWVGLSAVKTNNPEDKPLACNTNTGRLINTIELMLPNISFHKTNLVKCLPLHNDKIRYPSMPEMDQCYFHLDGEIDLLNPKVVFLLGKQVAAFVLKKFGISVFSLNMDFRYDIFNINGTVFIPVHHPSFVLVYKRKKLNDYMAIIEDLVNQNVKPSNCLGWQSIVKTRSFLPEPELV